jgi:hypothetical protein
VALVASRNDNDGDNEAYFILLFRIGSSCVEPTYKIGERIARHGEMRAARPLSWNTGGVR